MAGHRLTEGHEVTVGESAIGDRMMNQTKVAPVMVNLGPNAQVLNARKVAVEGRGQEADSETGWKCLEEAAINHSPC